jgi:hypothetical protein
MVRKKKFQKFEKIYFHRIKKYSFQFKTNIKFLQEKKLK